MNRRSFLHRAVTGLSAAAASIGIGKAQTAPGELHPHSGAGDRAGGGPPWRYRFHFQDEWTEIGSDGIAWSSIIVDAERNDRPTNLSDRPHRVQIMAPSGDVLDLDTNRCWDMHQVWVLLQAVPGEAQQ